MQSGAQAALSLRAIERSCRPPCGTLPLSLTPTGAVLSTLLAQSFLGPVVGGATGPAALLFAEASLPGAHLRQVRTASARRRAVATFPRRQCMAAPPAAPLALLLGFSEGLTFGHAGRLENMNILWTQNTPSAP